MEEKILKISSLILFITILSSAVVLAQFTDIHKREMKREDVGTADARL